MKNLTTLAFLTASLVLPGVTYGNKVEEFKKLKAYVHVLQAKINSQAREIEQLKKDVAMIKKRLGIKPEVPPKKKVVSKPPKQTPPKQPKKPPKPPRPPFYSTPGPEIGRRGYVEWLAVTQIVDDKNMVGHIWAKIRHNPEARGHKLRVWVTGMDTVGMVDDRKYNVKRVFKITGTKRYETLFGSSTVFVLEPSN